jgi:hypothetical protein
LLIASVDEIQAPRPKNGVSRFDAGHSRFLEGWPRDSDLGIIAMATWEINRWEPIPVGAACLRRTPDSSPQVSQS